MTSNLFKHGYARQKGPEYHAWCSMKQRCSQPNAHNYPLYGGRGITVCEKWRLSFPDFLADIGFRPSPQHSIERVDNAGHYEPSNVRWGTRAEQNSNRRDNRRYVVNGESKTVSELSREWGINIQTLFARLYKGWPVEKAVSQPVRQKMQPHK